MKKTQYTISEARKAASCDEITKYHKEIIVWLCDEVDRLSNPSKGLSAAKLIAKSGSVNLIEGRSFSGKNKYKKQQ